MLRGAAMINGWGGLALISQVGLAGAVVRISGTNTAKSQSGTRVELGGRIAIAPRFGVPRFSVAPVVGLHALFFPRPNEATATPEGNIGTFLGLWLGLSAGVSCAQ